MRQRNHRTESKEMSKLLPFQTKHQPLLVNSIEAARQALPFFGGTAPDAPAEKTEESDSTSDSTTDASATKSAGGDGSTLTPEQIASIVAQNADLVKTTKDLTGKLDNYTKQEADAEKAKLGDIERRDREIAERDETIVNMDKVIRALAVENAIAQSKDLKFHSTKHVINELDPTEYEIDVDLKTGTAVVSNLDKAMKRIAEANPWMVVDASKDNPGGANGATRTGNQNPGGAPARRGSGAPPSPGASRQSDATQRRSDLLKKFPVLAAGKPR